MKKSIIKLGIAVFCVTPVSPLIPTYAAAINNLSISNSNQMKAQSSSNDYCNRLKTRLRNSLAHKEKLKKEIKDLEQYLSNAKTDRRKLNEQIKNLQGLVAEFSIPFDEPEVNTDEVIEGVRTRVRQRARIDRALKRKLRRRLIAKVFLTLTAPEVMLIYEVYSFAKDGYDAYQAYRAIKIGNNDIANHKKLLSELEKKINKAENSLTRLKNDLSKTQSFEQQLKGWMSRTCPEEKPVNNCRYSERQNRMICDNKKPRSKPGKIDVYGPIETAPQPLRDILEQIERGNLSSSLPNHTLDSTNADHFPVDKLPSVPQFGRQFSKDGFELLTQNY